MVGLAKETRVIGGDGVEHSRELCAGLVALEMLQIVRKRGEPSLPQPFLKAGHDHGPLGIAQGDAALGVHQL